MVRFRGSLIFISILFGGLFRLNLSGVHNLVITLIASIVISFWAGRQAWIERKIFLVFKHFFEVYWFGTDAALALNRFKRLVRNFPEWFIAPCLSCNCRFWNFVFLCFLALLNNITKVFTLGVFDIVNQSW